MTGVLRLPLPLPLHQAVNHRPVEYVHTTGWTGLLALEPRLEACRVEDMSAGELLAARDHFFTTYDANVADCLQFFNGSIRIAIEKGTCGKYYHNMTPDTRNRLAYRVLRWRIACCEAITS